MVLNEIMVRAIVPFVENNMKKLDVILDQRKRGLKNSFKNIFKPKDRSDAFAYQINSIEHNSRNLADLAFLFWDYEEAAIHYKAIINDLKNAKAWSHAGSVFEMMALCTLLTTGDMKEVEYLMDSAYSYYQKAGDQALLTRCMLLTKQIFSSPEYSKKLAIKLINCSNDVREIKAVYPLFMEQTGLCYLNSTPSYYFFKIRHPGC